MAGGIEAIAATIGADLHRRLPGQNKKQREGLALLTATMLDVRSANLMDVAASLPRDAERLDMRYQWISRLLGNELIDSDEVMAPFASELLQRVGADGRQIILIIDQTQANETQQAIVVAARVGGRSLPIAWCVKETTLFPRRCCRKVAPAGQFCCVVCGIDAGVRQQLWGIVPCQTG
jgi:hypothetical protein